ncbi:flagellar assembly protein FliH [Simplicispira psychrophila]|uniref:FliH/SctL family protein n=1 Tax=Simplicispira psychrophila TaxID=80882 RepID=UPI00316ABD7D
MKTPSSKARAYSRFIPREDVGAFTPWRFAAVDGSDALLPKPEAVADAVVDAEAEAVAVARQAAEEVARQEKVRQERDDAYTQGLEKGRADTTIEWQQRMDDYIAGAGHGMAQRLDAVVQTLGASLEGMRQHMAQDVLQLACDLARQVVRQELHVNPAALQPVVAEALDMLVADGRPTTVRLNPADHAAVSAALREDFAATPVQWLADAQVPEGGCLVDAGGTVVDGSLEKRWQRAVAPLGLESAWNNPAEVAEIPQNSMQRTAHSSDVHDAGAGKTDNTDGAGENDVMVPNTRDAAATKEANGDSHGV